MSKKETKRAEIIDELTTHFLETGLADTGLRRLGEMVATSDRMLLYYFENKDELITEILSKIGAGLAERLTEVFGNKPRAPAKALRLLWRTAKSDVFANELRLRVDLASRASRGDPLFGAIAEQMSANWKAWLAAILDVPKAQRAVLAGLIIGAVDGQLVLYPSDLSKGDAAIAKLARLLT